MAVPSSGQLKLNADINLEINGTGAGTDVSLNGLSAQAGFTAPNGMEEFYGYVDAIAPSVTTNGASSVGTTSMVLNGDVTADGGATITSRGFYFGTSSNYASNAKITVSGTTGSFALSRSGLSQNTRYYFTAFAINSVGETVGSTNSQLTNFTYTFRTSQIGQSGGNSGSRYSSFYYSNVAGGWIANGGIASNAGTSCVSFCTNRTNLLTVTVTSGTQTRYSDAYKSSGCASGVSISGYSTTGDWYNLSSTKIGAYYTGGSNGSMQFQAS